ncbi:luciferase-like domain-containing protein [Aspergillus carlsbadensis]|nr:luciferase-like domain-containing protein [Aspergillus carlsbadensis]
MNTPGHLAPGLWRHPRNRTAEYNDISFWQDFARVLETGKFHGVFLADVLSHYDVYKGPGNIDISLPGAAQFPTSDPLFIVPIMAAVTTQLSFVVTVSTTYDKPYPLARKFTTLDHLTKGRVAWNVVTSHLDGAARNFGLDEQIPHDERYALAEEFLEATYKLWEGSWRDDAVVKRGLQYAVPGRVRAINHDGKYFKTAGPLASEPSRQRTPLLFQAGSSSAGLAFGTKHAEVMFVSGSDPKKVKKSVDQIHEAAAKNGRAPGAIKVIVAVTVIVDETDEKAQAKYADYLSYADEEGMYALFGGWTGIDLSKFSEDEDFRFSGPGLVQGLIASWSDTAPESSGGGKWTKRRMAREFAIGGVHPRTVGSAKTTADFLQHFQEVSGVDGFNIGGAIYPADFEDVVKYLLPELRARGLFWGDYVASTARENYSGDGQGPRLRADHPGAGYQWHGEK